MEGLGWQDWVCLQCTNVNWSCKAKCQGCLAARQWGHGVCHIGVYGICYRQWVWCWHDPGQWAGQLGWSSLGGDVETHRGATHYFQLQCQPWHGVRLFFTADACRKFYRGVCFIAPWGMNIIYHYLFRIGVSCSSTVLFPALVMGAFTAPSDLVACLPTAPELWHFACQWPLLEQPLQMAFCAGQLSQPGECEWVQLGHCGVHFFGVLFWGWQPWQRAWMALLAHITAAPDSMA